MRIGSAMTHTFSTSPSATIPRSSFNRTHGHKTTFDAGYLVPIYVDEALPGDTFNLKLTAFSRLATPLFPFMDNLFMDSFFFAVPYRLVWDNWQKFNGEQRNPGDSTDFLVPQMVSPVGGYAAQSLQDYMGLPTLVAGFTHSSLFLRAYALIWNEWFRDENLQDSIVVDVDDGPDSPSDYVLQRRGKRYDYFTSALPWAQKGPSVPLPLGSTAPVFGNQDDVWVNNGLGDRYLQMTNASGTLNLSSNAGNSGAINWGTIADPFLTGLSVDLSEATAATINQLRQAFQIQKLYERDARGGTRYIEILKSHFGVTSPDARLQRPEYLGGGSSPIMVNPVAQTSSTDGTSPQANLAAYGTSTLINHGFHKSFVEHCIIIGMVSVRADLNYQQGLNRMWSRRTRWDFYWPALSHIGEQTILNKEIYLDGTSTDDQVFGYQERYAEYRYKPSQISGQFRSNYAQTLDSWHLAQNFASLPVLNASFIVENPPVDRIKALGDDYPDFLFDGHITLFSARPMPVNGVPGLIDHF